VRFEKKRRKKISVIPGATGKPTGILTIFFLLARIFSRLVICPDFGEEIRQKTLLGAELQNAEPSKNMYYETKNFIIAYISSVYCNNIVRYSE